MRKSRLMVRETGEKPVVVDASIAVKWFAPEADSVLADRLIADDRILVAPDIMPVEAANAWWKKVRRGEMEKADLGHAVASLLAMGLEWIPVLSLVERAATLAADTGHTVYDCTYWWRVPSGGHGSRRPMSACVGPPRGCVLRSGGR